MGRTNYRNQHSWYRLCTVFQIFLFGVLSGNCVPVNHGKTHSQVADGGTASKCGG